MSLESLHAENGHRCNAWCCGGVHLEVCYVNPERRVDELAAVLAEEWGVEMVDAEPAPEAKPSPLGDGWPPYTVRYREGVAVPPR